MVLMGNHCSATQMAQALTFTTDQLFTLAALPGLVGATLRFVYTYMPALIGGKNWTFISTLILLVPVVWLGFCRSRYNNFLYDIHDFNCPHRFSGWQLLVLHGVHWQLLP